MRRLTLSSLCFVIVLVGSIAVASPGPERGHPPLKGSHHETDHQPSSGPASQQVVDGFEVLGHSNLGGGSPHGDVYVYEHEGAGKHAYVGTWASPCSGNGVKVVDVNDPSKPKVVAYAGARQGVSNEDIAVQTITTDEGGPNETTRDVLAIGVQACRAGAEGGLQLIDVTDPSKPKDLAFYEILGGGVHELDLVMRDDGRALALLAVPFTELYNTYSDFYSQFFPPGTLPLDKEFQIVDVSDPTAPFLASDWGVIEDSDLPIVAGDGDEVSSSFQGIGSYAAYYAHSARAADGGMTAYVSYWDGGILKFDISDPESPDLVGRTVYPGEDDTDPSTVVTADGDGHSMTPFESGGKRYILQNDEDTDPYEGVVVTSSATGSTAYFGLDEQWMPDTLSEGGTTVSGDVHDAGDGCETSDFTGATGKIALIDTWDPFYVGILDGWAVPCSIGSQTLRAADAGVDAIVFNLISPDDPWPFFRGNLRAVQQAAQGIPAVMIADIDGLAAAIRGAGGAQSITLEPSSPAHGFLRIVEEVTGQDIDGDPSVDEYAQVAAFGDETSELPNVTGTLTPPPGTWTIHNTEVFGDTAFSSWFSHGVVAIDLSDPLDPQFAGQFVPSVGKRFAGSLGVGPTEFWGVAIDSDGIIYGSDMRSGLWILQFTG